MSVRKGKKPAEPKKSAAKGGNVAEPEVAQPTNGVGSTHDEGIDAEAASGDHEAVDAFVAAGDPPEDAVPAISQINELRPRGEADPTDPDAAVEVATNDEEDLDELVEDAPPAAAPTTRAHLKRVIESLIFVSDQIITALQLARIVKAKQAEVRELVAEISAEYAGRGIELIEVAGGYQFRSAAASAPFVRDLVSQRPVRLTRAQLETLALIAYRQPITRPEIDDVRGVDSGSAIKVLLERDLVKILGRKDEAGRPLLYGTSAYFLEFFSMKTMQDLPTLREFTELNQEHRELFQRKTGEIPDLSSDAEARPISISDDDDEDEGEELDSETAKATVASDTRESNDTGESTEAGSSVEADVVEPAQPDDDVADFARDHEAHVSEVAESDADA